MVADDATRHSSLALPPRTLRRYTSAVQLQFKRGTALRRALFYSGVSLLLLFVLHAFWLAGPARDAGPRNVTPLRLAVTPSSLTVAQAKTIRVVAEGELGAQRLALRFSGLGEEREVEATELQQGVTVPVRPDRVGTFKIQLVAGDAVVASAPVTVGFGAELGRAPRMSLKLEVGTPRPAKTHYFELPVVVVTHATRGETTKQSLPKSVSSDVRVMLRGQGVPRNTVLVVPRGSAQSDPVSLPFDPGARYVMSAEAQGFEASPAVTVLWTDHKDLLKLNVTPLELTRYATSATPAEFHVFLTHDDLRMVPPQPLTVTVERGRDIIGTPKVELTASGSGTWEARAAGTVRDASIVFAEPDTGLRQTVRVNFVFPWGMLAAAAVAGVFGIVAARRSNLLRLSRSTLAFELGAAAIGAGVLYFSIIQGWLTFVAGVPSLIGYPPAVLVGVLGGYMGNGAFQLVLRGVQWATRK